VAGAWPPGGEKAVLIGRLRKSEGRSLGLAASKLLWEL